MLHEYNIIKKQFTFVLYVVILRVAKDTQTQSSVYVVKAEILAIYAACPNIHLALQDWNNEVEEKILSVDDKKGLKYKRKK